MKFWKIDDLQHENKHIHYNKQYSGNIYLGDEDNYKIYPIKFRIEIGAFNTKVKDIEISGSPEYPFLELYTKIKEYINLYIL